MLKVKLSPCHIKTKEGSGFDGPVALLMKQLCTNVRIIKCLHCSVITSGRKNCCRFRGLADSYAHLQELSLSVLHDLQFNLMLSET
jgi:hypothetical protein